ncbi:serine threonine kinase [Fusarium beomiforme]|uniref:Serine threonine kinase n=1 Tax=Fusarium beomiforme TaxID=44412 RepID=A0A9P5A7D9_9HYPO|nr:serine threonine kinase [Fusarium beomiforme]
MSWLNSASNSRIWMTALGIPGDDPYRSKNTATEMRNSHVPKLFRESTKVGHVGNGGVFDVSLYEHNSTLYAVKKARKDYPGGGKIAFQEIQVVSKLLLRHHTNIIDIRGWDWSDDQLPVLFTYFAEQRTLRDFLQRSKSISGTIKRHFAIDIASGIHALHAADIAHGDIKLINTLVFPDPRVAGSWIAKVSDFSHSVFGLSLRRQTSYLGTVLYNAPEVRDRNSHIPSHELIRCESFSYGLLLWEILSDGEEYINPAWIGGEPEMEGTARRERFLQRLPKNGLLNLALSFLCSKTGCLSGVDMTLFYNVFEMTLKDNPAYRKDLATIATRLDCSDRANIVHSSADSSLEKINVWANHEKQDFDPWQKEPWLSKEQFVGELQDNLSNPRQPNHAEFHFLLSRCYTEGYGVSRSLPTAVHHLVEAANLGSIDAIWVLEAYRGRLPGHEDFNSRPACLGNESQSSVLTAIREVVEMVGMVTSKSLEESSYCSTSEVTAGVEFPTYLYAWNGKSALYTHEREFTAQLGDGKTKFSWLRGANGAREIAIRAKHYGVLVCNVNVHYATLLSPNTTAPFLEVCASLGIESYLGKEQLGALQDSQFTDASYRSQGQFYLRLLVIAARHGQWALIKYLIKLMREIYSEKRPENPPQIETENGESPLHYLASLKASHEERLAYIRDLQDLGHDFNGILTARSWLLPFGIELYGTPLQVAIRCKCLRTVKALVEAGADVSLSYGDAPPPLILATSLHCSLIVDYLLDISSGARKAIDSLGAPTKKGWFEHLFPEVEGDCRLHNFIATTRLFIDRFLTPDENGYSAWKYQDLDGSPLLEAVRKGQKNLRIFAALIKLGLGPHSFQGRWKLLDLILCQEKKDPFRVQLLQLLLSRRDIERAIAFVGSLDSPESHGSKWIDGWADFFQHIIRGNCGHILGLPLMHFLVQNGDIEIINLILTFYRHAAPGLVSQKNSKGLTPFHLAILQNKKPLFWVLVDPVISKLRAMDMEFSKRSIRDVAQEEIDTMMSRKRVKKLCTRWGMSWDIWKATFDLNLTYRGPEWQVLQLIATREASKRRAQATFNTHGFKKFAHEACIHSAFTRGNQLEISRELEKYAVWTLEWEEYGLNKAEDICVLMNVVRMEAVTAGRNRLRKARKVALSSQSPWWAPKEFVKLYDTQGMLGKSASEMIYDAYCRLERATPSWLEVPKDQGHRIGVECMREWFERGYRTDHGYQICRDWPLHQLSKNQGPCCRVTEVEGRMSLLNKISK